MEPTAERTVLLQSANAVFCVLDAEPGFEMHREKCPDGQFWICSAGNWTIHREGKLVGDDRVTYYAPREPSHRIVERPIRSIGIQIKNPLLAQIVHQEETRIHEVSWPLQRAVLQLVGLWQLGELDKDSLEERAAMLPFSGKPQVNKGTWLEAIKAKVADELEEPLNLREMAEQAGFTPSHICSSFRKEYGVTLSRFRQQLRLQRTFDLSMRDGVSLYEAAAECGFYDASHFHRVAKAELGMTPTVLHEFFKSKSRTRFVSSG